jgi:hypothetical protein
MNRHTQCYAGIHNGKRGHWSTCIECDGRLHSDECTSALNPKLDCCPERHAKQGLSVHTAYKRPSK